MAIKHNYLNTADLKPQVSEIEQGELVPNLADGTLWSKNAGGTVIQISPVLSGYLLNTTDTLTGNLTVTGTMNSSNFKNIGTSIAISSDGTALSSDVGNDNNNIGIGDNAGLSTTGNNNILIGDDAGKNLTTGNSNLYLGDATGIGYGLSPYNTGNGNIGIGYFALSTISSGSYNIAIGRNAGKQAYGSMNNILFGFHTGYNINGGEQNILIGYFSGLNASGNDNICLGTYSGHGLTTESNQLRIGNIDIDGTNEGLIEGDISLETVTINGDLDVTGTLDVQTVDSTIKAGSNTLKFAQNAVDATTGNLGVGSNMHLDAPSSGQLYLNYYGGTGGVIFGSGATTQVAKVDSSGKIYSFATEGLTLSTDGALTLGSTSSVNLALDTNEVQARNNGANSALYLNRLGGNVIIGETDSTADLVTINGLTEFAITDNVADVSKTGVIIDHNCSGADILTGDRTHSALLVDMDSSATGGDTANEHRMYGINSQVSSSQDSDLIVGIISNTVSTMSTTDTVSAMSGLQAYTNPDNTLGTVTNSHGIFADSQNQNAGTVTHQYGVWSRALKQNLSTSTTASMTGLYGEIEISEGAGDVTNAYCVRAQFDNNVTTSGETAAGTSYLFHGDYVGTIPTNAYGVYIPDNVPSYFGGDVTSNRRLMWEGGKHSISNNDGNNITFNFGMDSETDKCTENGYATTWVNSQLTGLWTFKVSNASMAIDDTPVFDSLLSFGPGAINFFAQTNITGSLDVSSNAVIDGSISTPTIITPATDTDLTITPNGTGEVVVSSALTSKTLNYLRSTSLLTNSNIDFIIESGFYDINVTDAGVANTPGTGWWYVTDQRHTNDNGYRWQTARSFGATGGYFHRIESGGTWSAWRQLLDDSDISFASRISLTTSVAKDIGTTASDIEWNTQDHIDSGSYTHSTTVSNNSITVLSDGTYSISMNAAHNNTGAARATVYTKIQVNNIDIPQSYDSQYSRGQIYSTNLSTDANLVLDLLANDVITVEAGVEDSDAVYVIDRIPAQCSITIMKVGIESAINTWRNIDNTPVNGATSESISSDWAYKVENETMTIDGVKTFSQSPLAPTKTTGNDTTAVATTEFVQQEIAASGGSPAGVAFDFYGATAPSGALACLGQEVSKTTYAILYAAIGDLWATTGGAATPTTGNFRLPPQQIGDLGLYSRGVGTTNGSVGTYEADVFKSHNHTSGAALTYVSGGGQVSARSSGNGYNGFNDTTTSAGNATETRPRSITVLKCVWTGL